VLVVGRLVVSLSMLKEVVVKRVKGNEKML
jgi:hypothetical protein